MGGTEICSSGEKQSTLDYRLPTPAAGVEKRLRAGIGVGVYHDGPEEMMVAFITDTAGEVMRSG